VIEITPTISVTQVTKISQITSVTQVTSSQVTPVASISPTQDTTSSIPKECKLPTLPFSHNLLEDMYIVGHVLHEQVVVTEAQCEDLCLRAHHCLGFNFNLDQNGSKHCELLDHIESFSSKVGFSFRLFDRNSALQVLSVCTQYILTVIMHAR
jgi:hypothetical protein